ncbi:hypothetical protein B0H12DRAFT_1150072 [Mycena haematopus]|nr:hypothetical protein B0H12DRAFT_1150072 [Mycena haematopus]
MVPGGFSPSSCTLLLSILVFILGRRRILCFQTSWSACPPIPSYTFCIFKLAHSFGVMNRKTHWIFPF